jgi:hypothetical protein
VVANFGVENTIVRYVKLSIILSPSQITFSVLIEEFVRNLQKCSTRI